jgi:hypothetical protein
MSMHGTFGFEKKKGVRDAEPIPLHHIRIPERTAAATAAQASLKSVGDDIPVVKKTPRSQSIDELQISLSQAARYNTGQISKDLMDCLDKMTYHSIADENPFEPIPLAPQQEKAHLLKKGSAPAAAAAGGAGGSGVVVRPSIASSTSSAGPVPVDPFSSNPMLDESERDEFAEE